MALLALPGRALAGEVHFDPDSPAGKEYALPLTQARDEGGAGKKHGSGDSAATPEDVSLFGVGVAPAGAGAADVGPDGKKDRGEDGSGRRESAKGSGGRGKADRDEQATGVPAAVDERAGYSFGGGLLLLALLSAAGIGAGFGIRALRRGGARPSG